MTPGLHIVTGVVNTGKTSRMKELYCQTPSADGFLSEKVFSGGVFLGYRLVRLRSGEGRLFALTEEAFHGQYREICRLGPFIFSQEAFSFGIRGLLSLYRDDNVTAIFLDEAGPLELGGLGFARILPILLHSGKDIYLTVRRACLEQFLIEFDIGEYELISVPDP